MSDTVGSVAVEVVPDARGWAEKLNAQIRDQVIKVKAEADTTEADAELDRAAHTRTAKIKADVSQLSKGNDVLGSFVDKLGLLPALAVAAGGALVPLAATLGGVAASLAAPLAIAGGGATLFAFLGGFAVKDTEKQLKNVDTLQKKLGGLTKGTKSYNSTLQQLNQAQAALTPAQVKFAGALDKLKLSFHGLLEGQNGQALLGPITQGIEALAKILPATEPLIRSVSGAFSTLLTQVSDAASGPGFERFMRMFSRQAGGDIVGFGHILGNITTGLGGLFGVLDRQVGHSLVDELGHLTGEFSHWANSRGGRQEVKGFLEYFHQVGPDVAHAIAAVARALGKVVEALAPLGPPVLKALTEAANAIAAIPPGALTGILAGVGGLSVAAYGAKKAQGFKGLIPNVLSAVGLGAPGVAGKGVVPVYVTNPGFGGPGGGRNILTTALEDSATFGIGARIAKALGAELPDGAEVGRFSRFLARFGLDLPLPALGSEVNPQHLKPINLTTAQQEQMLRSTYGLGTPGSVTGRLMDPATLAKTYNLSTADVSRLLGTAQLRSTGTAFDGLRAAQARLSAGYDVMGRSAVVSSAVVIHALRGVQAELNHLPAVKQMRIEAQTQDALRGLAAVYAAENRLHDRYLTIYQRNQTIDQIGGRHQSTPGGSGGGSAGGRAAALARLHTGPSRFTLKLDDAGRHTLTGFVQQHADDVYHANQDYERARRGE